VIFDASHRSALAWELPARVELWDRDASTHRQAKRVLDVVACLLLLPVALPLLALCVVAIQLGAPGAPLARQTCAGRGGRRFTLYRLRTTGTRAGRLVRWLRLDGLPQLYNVLRGEMSLVGPRPVSFGTGATRLWHTARFDATPGIVSAAQVSGGRDLDHDARLRLEIAYIRNASLALDAWILLQAAGLVLRGGYAVAVRALAVELPAAPTRAPARAPAAVAGAWSTAVRRLLTRYWAARSALLAASDGAAVVAAIAVSYYLRFGPPGAGRGGPSMSAEHFLLYAKSGVLLAAMWCYGLWRDGAYRRELRGFSVPAVRMGAIAASGAYAVAALMAIGFLYRDLLLSRQVYLLGAVLATAAVAGVRALFSSVDRYVAVRGDVSARIAIVGANATAYEFAETLKREAPSMQVAGFLSDAESVTAGADDRTVLGHMREIPRLQQQLRFDTLVLASPRLSAAAMEGDSESWVSLLNFCEERGISLYILAGSFSVAVSPHEVASFSGRPLIRLKDASLDPTYALVKRGVDLAIASVGLACGLPVWLALAALVKLTSPGPLLFTQWRAGQHGRPFRMYKFRSMAADAEATLGDLIDVTALKEPVFKLKNDPRVTPLGRWMRRTGLDEIPQLLNVLLGDMSVVGPRPEEVRLVDQYTPSQRRRLKAKPGITGYQQIRNRGGTSLAERVKYDLVYLKHQSLVLDLYILCNTPLVLIRGSGITH
jgi:exopolysaccharide biosynthesis polyprenyl glycosylphosphotransferase